jgi:hypothetical protein
MSRAPSPLAPSCSRAVWHPRSLQNVSGMPIPCCSRASTRSTLRRCSAMPQRLWQRALRLALCRRSDQPHRRSDSARSWSCPVTHLGGSLPGARTARVWRYPRDAESRVCTPPTMGR